MTSGLALPLVLVLVWQAFRLAPRADAHTVAIRRAAVAAGVFIVLEAALGAGLVLFRYVAYNPSYARAVWMAAHLVNTLLLLGALTLVAWWARGGSVPRRVSPVRAASVGAALAAVLVLAVGGAVTALADTLAVGGGLDPADHPVVAALVGVRWVHPAIAFVALGVVSVSVWASRGTAVVQRGTTVLALFVVQMGLGAINVGLNVPVWMQIVHLLMTDVLWIALVVWAAEALARRAARGAHRARPGRGLMCVLFVAVGVHPRHAVVLAGNRDEAHARPTAAARPLDRRAARHRRARPRGRRHVARRDRRWALGDRHECPRPGASVRSDARSRGALVADFLRGEASPEAYARARAGRARRVQRLQPARRRPRAGAWIASTRRDGRARSRRACTGSRTTRWTRRGPSSSAAAPRSPRPFAAAHLAPTDLLAFLPTRRPRPTPTFPRRASGSRSNASCRRSSSAASATARAPRRRSCSAPRSASPSSRGARTARRARGPTSPPAGPQGTGP